MIENLPSHQINWDAELKGAKLLIDSGLVPKDVRSPQTALFIIMTGRDMGLSPVQSLRGIKPIQGKIECSADLQLGLYHRSGGKSQWVEITDKQAVLKLLAPWSIEPHISTFTIEDARRAELLSNPTWRKYPKAMLRSRAITQGLKDIGFLLGAGVYAPGELGGSVIVNEVTGEVLPASEEQQPMREISSTAGTVETLADDHRNELQNHALTISKAVRNKQIEAALNDWHKLNTDNKVAVWAMMDKDVRKLLKAADKAKRESSAPPTIADVRTQIEAKNYADARALARDIDLLEADRAALMAEIDKAELR